MPKAYDLTDEEACGDESEDDEDGAIDPITPIWGPETLFEQRGAADEPHHAVRALQKAEDEECDGVPPGRVGAGVPDQTEEQPDDGTEEAQLDPENEKQERPRLVPVLR